MSCDNCDCMECRVKRAIIRAKALENESVSFSPWKNADKANEVQAKAWGESIDQYLSQYGKGVIHLRTMVSALMYRHNVRIENESLMAPQVERFIHENYIVTPDRKVGGKLKYISMTSIASLPFTAPELLAKESFTIKSIKDDYTCPCGNTKCSKVEKSCWKCGAEIKP